MSKPDELDNMQVVEIDAIDFGDWERNMKTSEVEMAHLRTLIRETAAQPVVAPPPQRAPQPRVAPIAAPAPTPAPATARPSLVPAPAPELTPLDAPEDPAIDLRPRFPLPRVLLFAGSALAGVLVVVVMIVVQRSPAPARAPAAPQVVASPAVQPAAPAPVAEQHQPPPPPAPAKTAPPPAAHPAPIRGAGAPAVATTRAPAAPVAKAPAAPVAKAPAPAPRPKTVRRVRPARKTVAVRTAPQPAAPAVAEDAVDRARAAYTAGNEALFAGDSDTAIRAYLQVLELSPTFAFGQRGLGLAYAQKGDTEAAIKALREYLRLAPKAKDVPLIKKRIRSLQAARH